MNSETTFFLPLLTESSPQSSNASLETYRDSLSPTASKVLHFEHPFDGSIVDSHETLTRSWIFTYLAHYNIPTSDHTISLKELGNHGFLLKSKILEVLQKLLPRQWRNITDPNVITLTRITGAMTNMIYKLEANINFKKFSCLLRVYGIGVEQFVERDRELLCACRLSEQGCAPKLLGVFNNGRFEEFIDSITLVKENLREPKISEIIAKELAKLHKSIFAMEKEEKNVELWDKLWDLFDLASVSNLELKSKGGNLSKTTGFDLSKIKEEILHLKKFSAKIDSPVVFAHNDLQYGNILQLNSDKNKLMLVDFEYAAANYRGYDFGNHFCEWAADYHSANPHLLDYTKYPSKNEQFLFFQSYLKEFNCEKMNYQVTVEELNEIYKETEFYSLLSHIFWGLWGEVFATLVKFKVLSKLQKVA
ncbi:hypothetical protein HDU92_007817 [Lobulomyces angularis]|nr:hypothetical protein HDU92_007817 [Lobulomyces angularis]